MAEIRGIWQNLAEYDGIWQILAKYGSVWQNLAKFSEVWWDLAEFSRIWQNLAELGRIWQNLAGGWRRRDRSPKGNTWSAIPVALLLIVNRNKRQGSSPEGDKGDEVL